MSNEKASGIGTDELTPESHRRPTTRGPVRGTLDGITAEGFILVRWREGEARAAMLALAASHRALLDAVEQHAPVLLDFLDGDPEQPVILGLLRDRLDVDARDPAVVTEARIELSASRQLLLRCGESAVELHDDGRVVIRGTDVQSISSGSNKLTGASVDIN
jgi:hypothetical protein